MAMPLLGRGGDGSHPEMHSHTRIHVYVYVVCTYIQIHRCAKGADEDGAGWGGSMAPINGLIMAATQDATPGWEEIQKRRKSKK